MILLYVCLSVTSLLAAIPTAEAGCACDGGDGCCGASCCSTDEPSCCGGGAHDDYEGPRLDPACSCGHDHAPGAVPCFSSDLHLAVGSLTDARVDLDCGPITGGATARPCGDHGPLDHVPKPS